MIKKPPSLQAHSGQISPKSKIPMAHHPIKLAISSLLLLLPISSETPTYPCRQPPNSNASFPFCNSSLPIPTRSKALISLLTLQEKISLLSNNASSVPRLALPSYQWWSESLHGIAVNGPGVSFSPTIPAATSFPQVIVTAASFNRSLWRHVASAIGVEARAMYNVGQAGLTFWAPNVNVFRDPRWGRGQETAGEDPRVMAEYAFEYVKGFQFHEGEEGKGRMRVSACCKHYVAYDLEKWGNFTRYTFDAQVTDQDMADTFEPPFRSCIEEAKASCLMCSYNQVNGVPACARHDLLQKVRDEWGFNGYITSDCDAVAVIYEDQKFAASPEDAVAYVLKAGMDINCGTYLLRHTESAVKLGKVQEKDIDRALFNLFSIQLRLGLFDGNPANQQFGNLGPNDVCTHEHRKLALEAARQGIVLLKNDENFLPLKKKEISSLAIIGPAANDPSILGGDYVGIPCNPISLFIGLQDYVLKTSFASGCNDVPCESDEGFNEAIHAALEAEVVVVVVGLNLTEETEDHDRTSLQLPGKQMNLVNSITRVSKNPIILVLMGGGPLDVSFAKENSQIASILWIGYPGEIGGQVLAEAIFGDFNPGGRLPITWYPESFTKVPMNDMNMRADPSRGYPGRTYRFYTGNVVYEFGYGLSYSSYSYKFILVPEKISLFRYSTQAHINTEPQYTTKDGLDYMHIDKVSSCEALRFHTKISVRNNGDMDGSHVVLLFSKTIMQVKGSPKKQLIGFERVYIKAKSSSEIGILVDPCKHLSVVNKQGERILLLGAHILMLENLEHSLYIEI